MGLEIGLYLLLNFLFLGYGYIVGRENGIVEGMNDPRTRYLSKYYWYWLQEAKMRTGKFRFEWRTGPAERADMQSAGKVDDCMAGWSWLARMGMFWR